MNDPQERLSDAQIAEMLAPLRAVKLPDEAHTVNVDTVRRALSRNVRAVWWRRTVAVPIPVAIAATVALAFATVAMLRPSLQSRNMDRDGLGPTQVKFIATSTDPNRGADYAPSAAWSVSRSYIHSIESLANARAFLIVDLKENQDDS